MPYCVIEAELGRHHALRERWCQPARIEQRSLHGVVEARDHTQEAVDGAGIGDDIAARQQR
jgi:hypothetical protein